MCLFIPAYYNRKMPRLTAGASFYNLFVSATDTYASGLTQARSVEYVASVVSVVSYYCAVCIADDTVALYIMESEYIVAILES